MLANYEKSLEEIESKIVSIGDSLVKANEMILEALADCDSKKFNDAKMFVKNVDKKTRDIDNLTIKTLGLHQPEAKDLRELVAYLKITNELARASSNTRNFVNGFIDVCTKVDIDTINEYAIPMQKSSIQTIKSAISMIDCDDEDELRESFESVLVSQNKTTDLYDMVESSLVQQAKEIDDFSTFHNMLQALRKSEKISDRAMSIASLLLFAHIGGEIYRK
jgi:phosphate transport system protein